MTSPLDPFNPDLMAQSLDAMERGDHAEGLRLARESNRRLAAYMEAKHGNESHLTPAGEIEGRDYALFSPDRRQDVHYPVWRYGEVKKIPLDLRRSWPFCSYCARGGKWWWGLHVWLPLRVVDWITDRAWLR